MICLMATTNLYFGSIVFIILNLLALYGLYNIIMRLIK